MFEPHMNFVLHDDLHHHPFSMINRSPQQGAHPQYTSDLSDPSHKVYGVAALRPNLSSSAPVLILEGTSMAGTEAAADFIFDDALTSFKRGLLHLQYLRRDRGNHSEPALWNAEPNLDFWIRKLFVAVCSAICQGKRIPHITTFYRNLAFLRGAKGPRSKTRTHVGHILHLKKHLTILLSTTTSTLIIISF